MSAPYLTKSCTWRSTALGQEPLRDWSLSLTIFGSEFYHGARNMMNAGHSSLHLLRGAAQRWTLSSFGLPLNPTPFLLSLHLQCKHPLLQAPSQCLLRRRNCSVLWTSLATHPLLASYSHIVFFSVTSVHDSCPLPAVIPAGGDPVVLGVLGTQPAPFLTLGASEVVFHEQILCNMIIAKFSVIIHCQDTRLWGESFRNDSCLNLHQYEMNFHVHRNHFFKMLP